MGKDKRAMQIRHQRKTEAKRRQRAAIEVPARSGRLWQQRNGSLQGIIDHSMLLAYAGELGAAEDQPWVGGNKGT
jgi:hypothetical protein